MAAVRRFYGGLFITSFWNVPKSEMSLAFDPSAMNATASACAYGFSMG
jgi:hypothetical protein